MSEPAEQELIAKYLAGDEPALEKLIRRYLPAVFDFLCRMVKDKEVAEDLTQDCFVKLWKNIGKFDAEKRFKPWLFAIAKNTALDYLKKKKDLILDDEENLAILYDIPDTADLPDEVLAREGVALELDALLKSLPLKSQAVLHLYFREELTFYEIADVLGESINTVKSRQRRALLELRKKLA